MLNHYNLVHTKCLLQTGSYQVLIISWLMCWLMTANIKQKMVTVDRLTCSKCHDGSCAPESWWRPRHFCWSAVYLEMLISYLSIPTSNTWLISNIATKCHLKKCRWLNALHIATGDSWGSHWGWKSRQVTSKVQLDPTSGFMGRAHYWCAAVDGSSPRWGITITHFG